MDETGATTPLLGTRILLRALPSARRCIARRTAGERRRGHRWSSLRPPVVGQRSAGSAGAFQLEDSAGTENADRRSRSSTTSTARGDGGRQAQIAYVTEDLVILTCVRRLGTQWPGAAPHRRTPDAVRNRWHRRSGPTRSRTPRRATPPSTAADRRRRPHTGGGRGEALRPPGAPPPPPPPPAPPPPPRPGSPAAAAAAAAPGTPRREALDGCVRVFRPRPSDGSRRRTS